MFGHAARLFPVRCVPLQPLPLLRPWSVTLRFLKTHTLGPPRNAQITAAAVHVVDERNHLGEPVRREVALELARLRGMDLVQVSACVFCALSVVWWGGCGVCPVVLVCRERGCL